MNRKISIKGSPGLRPLAVGAAVVAMLLIGLITVSMAAPAAPVAPEGPTAPAGPLGKSNLGNFVWWDQDVNGDHNTAAEAEFLCPPNGSGINGVLINLYQDVNKDGVLNLAEQTPIATATTGDDPNTTATECGWYLFDVTADGNKYFVQVDPSNFQSGKPLFGYVQTSAGIYGPNVGPSAAWYPMLYVEMPQVIQDYVDADFGFARASLTITKAPPLQTLVVGGTATFQITVNNTGQVPLTNIVVTDANAPGCARTIAGPLAAGASTTYSCTVTNVQAGFFNVAQVTASTPINPNTGLPAPGAVPTGTSNQVEVQVANPKIDVEKEVSINGGSTWADADTAPGPYSNGPTAPKYRFVVTNTGNVVLTGITLVDSPTMILYGDINLSTSCAIPNSLAAGASFTCYSSQPWAAGQQTDTATATGTYTDGGGTSYPVTDSDAANYFGADPKVDVEKYVSIDGGTTWADADTAPGPYSNGPTAPKYRFVVTNTGNVPLSGVTLVDSPAMTFFGDANLSTSCTIPNPLAAGASFTCYASQAWAAGQQTDTATATGTFTDGNNSPKQATDSDAANYFGANPLIDVEKYVSIDGGTTWVDADTAPGPYSTGPTAPKYRFTVTNIGNVPLSGVTLTDSPTMTLFGDANLTTSCTIPAPLAAGASFTCYASQAWSLGPHVDTATATGTFTDGNNTPKQATDSDAANYFGANPKIDVEKEVSVDNGTTWVDADTAPGPTLANGVSPRFRFTVTNTGNLALSSVTLSDSMYSGLIASQCPGLPSTLAVGASFSCTITAPWAGGQHVNTATASGSFTDGSITLPASDTDLAHYLSGKTEITLIKTAGTAADGSILIVSAPLPVTVLYTYQVKNTGDMPVVNITVSDNLLGAICTIAGPLAAGASQNCTKSAPISADTQNLGTATGTAQDPQGNPIGSVTDSDDAIVVVRGRISDFIWFDGNANGVQDPGETGIPGVDVQLYELVNSVPVLRATTTTDASGLYNFEQLLGGSYQVVIPAYELNAGGSLAGFALTSAFSGGDPTKDSNGTAGSGGTVQALVILPAKTADVTIDFGFTKSSGFRVEKKLVSPSPARPGDQVHFQITIYNTGQTWLSTVPLADSYNIGYLAYGYPQPAPTLWSTPASNDNVNDGTINWTNVAPAGGVAPGGNVVVDVYFTALADTTLLPPDGKTINTATVQGVLGDPDGPQGPTQGGALGLPPQSGTDGTTIIAPTGVELTGLSATAQDGGVLLTWETGGETNIAGFNVLRSADGGELAAVNAELIFAEHAGATTGAAYSFVDSGAPSGACTYVLEVLHLDGSSTRMELGQLTF